MNELQRRATSGEELRVDYASIEETLSELWRVELSDENAVVRAALWNVVAHTATSLHHAAASETLGRAATSVPQRTIVIRADADAQAEMAAWISANCHLIGDGKQVCSEEIAILAGGDRVARVPPLVSALLIPDMPVAFWWHGDLPHRKPEYVLSLLEPADRLIVDSVNFDDPADLELVALICRSTATAPADLNWVRNEEWRVAAASLFDPLPMRARLGTLRSIRLSVDTTDAAHFGQWAGPLFFAAWLVAQAGVDAAGVVTEFDLLPSDRHGIARVEIELDGSAATIERDAERSVLTTNFDGHIEMPAGVMRSGTRSIDELIVRELQQPRSDRILGKVLPLALELAERVRQ